MTSTEEVQALLQFERIAQKVSYQALADRIGSRASDVYAAMNTSRNLQLATIDKIAKGLDRRIVFRLTKEET